MGRGRVQRRVPRGGGGVTPAILASVLRVLGALADPGAP